jgi:hypothetical protein
MKHILTSLALGLAATTPSLALDLVPFGEVGAWQIMVDPNHDNSCLTQVMFDDGSFMRLGLHDKGKKGFFGAFNPAWPEVKLDHRYAVAYQLDDDLFAGEARGMEIGEVRGLQIVFEDPAFLIDMAQKRVLTMNADGVDLGRFDLVGSGDAVKAMLACQAEQG